VCGLQNAVELAVSQEASVGVVYLDVGCIHCWLELVRPRLLAGHLAMSATTSPLAWQANAAGDAVVRPGFGAGHCSRVLAVSRRIAQSPLIVS
jgi:hypothetical protein